MSEKKGVLKVAEYFNGLTLYSPEAQVMPAAMSHVRVTLPMAMAMQECIRSMANCLAALEARAEAGVTEAMVERAAEALALANGRPLNEWGLKSQNAYRTDARSAILAALTGGASDA